jgi:hypothetical protein
VAGEVGSAMKNLVVGANLDPSMPRIGWESRMFQLEICCTILCASLAPVRNARGVEQPFLARFS